MASTSRTPTAAAERMRNYRKRMREAGYRQVQAWTKDTQDPAFLARLKAEARLITASDPDEVEVMEWIGKVYEWPED